MEFQEKIEVETRNCVIVMSLKVEENPIHPPPRKFRDMVLRRPDRSSVWRRFYYFSMLFNYRVNPLNTCSSTSLSSSSSFLFIIFLFFSSSTFLSSARSSSHLSSFPFSPFFSLSTSYPPTFIPFSFLSLHVISFVLHLEC